MFNWFQLKKKKKKIVNWKKLKGAKATIQIYAIEFTIMSCDNSFDLIVLSFQYWAAIVW